MIEQYPVSATYSPEGWQSPGIAYEDYSRMSTQKRQKPGQGRYLETPEWALNNTLLKKLIVRYVENRAGFRYVQPGTDEERLARAQKALDASMEPRAAVLKNLCRELIALKKAVPIDRARIRSLEQQIENIDTTLVSNRNVALLVAGVVYRYFRLGEDSVAVAQAMGCKPPHCRQIIWRLRRTWERLQKPQVVKTTQPWKPTNLGLVDVKRAAALRAQGLTYAQIDAALGCKGVIFALKKAALWVPAPWERAKAALNKAEVTLARLAESKPRLSERPLVIPRTANGKYCPAQPGTIQKHVEIFEKLIRENGGQLPSYSWMNNNGYFRTYELLRKFPDYFRHLAPEQSA